MSNGSIMYTHPIPLETAIVEMVIRAGRDPMQIMAVLDLHLAVAIQEPRPASRLERLVVLFSDWTFMHVQIDSSQATRQ
jgi:hypothetical protein